MSVRAVSAMELIKSLAVDDSSLKKIAETIKTHPVDRGMWLACQREYRKRVFDMRRRLREVEAEKVSKFAASASSAAAVSNYAKYDLVLDPDVKRAQRELDDAEEGLRFAESVDSVFKQRGELLAALMKLDHEVIVGAYTGNEGAVELTRRKIRDFNQLMENLDRPWGV